MPYTAPTFESIRSRFLRDVRSKLPDADISTDSDNHVRASSVAALAEGIHQQASWTARQIFPDTADFEELKKHAALRDVYPKSATPASGLAALTGTAGTTLAAGSQLRHVATGAMLVTTLAVTFSASGAASAPVATTGTGIANNGLEGAATLISPPLGVSSNCTLSKLIGGTDDESPESLLSRYLDVLRNPPSGGNESDYRRWALSVDGVSTVLVIPKRRGGNTVDIVITSAGGPSSDAVIAACQAYINSVMPAGADVWVFTPAILLANIKLGMSVATGYTLESIFASASAALKAVIDPLSPREMLYRQRLVAAVSAVPGVVDINVITPVSNVDASNDPAIIGWVRLGSVSLVPLS
jgi:uncharacterized phage protein gp47/JayE